MFKLSVQFSGKVWLSGDLEKSANSRATEVPYRTIKVKVKNDNYCANVT